MAERSWEFDSPRGHNGGMMKTLLMIWTNVGGETKLSIVGISSVLMSYVFWAMGLPIVQLIANIVGIILIVTSWIVGYINWKNGR